ncbi:Lrp/AsnC family transcriptional regulator [Vibrio mangrovi]|uniref:Leucine-responsive regulatory protein n=1 Tax=Vibrio mangrovi TaxID=474394 RepID=A0A1Y6ITZ6_9VIBR|nr:Lrp/AsnC family transcriptional regulator [Vibrio mangrovi]MDW6004805.1 Lrp/AsnC family transcriptional regulator [Vibrio mangrovi]SMS01096.1 Leucine-responsive regulatory protein [Vibrio mangrovi]
MQLDRYDIKILYELQQDGSLSNQELADRIGLTAAPCSRRVRQLQENGVIDQYVARVNERQIGLNLIALLHISMDKHIPERFAAFEQAIAEIPEVMECYVITGHDADYQLKIAVADMDSYHDILLGKITRIQGVSGVKSSFILRKIVDSTALPLHYVKRENHS